MDQNPAMKLAAAVATLVGIWIAVYWLWEPARTTAPPISIAREPERDPAKDRRPEEGGTRRTGDLQIDGRSRETGLTGPSASGSREEGSRGRNAGPEAGEGRPVHGPSGDEANAPEARGEDRGGDPKIPPHGKPESTAQGKPEAKPPSGPQVKPPQFEQYKVQQGETFETIAKKRFGSTAMASAIARANPFIDPRRLRAGRMILIPLDPANIQGKAEPAKDATREGWKVHKIVERDTLSAISMKYYGTTVLARKIYEANTDRLKSEHDLKIGLELLIPPAPPADKQGGDAGQGGGGSR